MKKDKISAEEFFEKLKENKKFIDKKTAEMRRFIHKHYKDSVVENDYVYHFYNIAGKNPHLSIINYDYFFTVKDVECCISIAFHFQEEDEDEPSYTYRIAVEEEIQGFPSLEPVPFYIDNCLANKGVEKKVKKETTSVC
jgi:hypothetical protein